MTHSLSVLDLDGGDGEEGEEGEEGEGGLRVVALTSRQKLLVDGVQYATEVTSMALHSAFVLYTTLAAQLCFVSRRHALTRSLAALADTQRAIESGAKLVAVSAHGTRVVLQMPRGPSHLPSLLPLLPLLHELTGYGRQPRVHSSAHLDARHAALTHR